MAWISIRIPEDDESELKAVSELLDEDTSTVIRNALSEGLSSIRRRIAIERYQSGEVSLNQAARIADMSLAEWFEIARESDLITQLTSEDLYTAADQPVGIISDDRRVRTTARDLGATVTGTVGVLARAVDEGLRRREAHGLFTQVDAHGLHMTAPPQYLQRYYL